MAEHLFIRLSAQQHDSCTWITTDASGRRSGLEQSGTLESAARKAQQHRVVLMVPGTEVVQTSARIPLRAGSKLRQAVPFALEDQLADDVENLHFAIGKRSDDGAYPVAITARDNMRDWLARMEAVGLRPRSIVADSNCVPATPGGMTIILEGDTCLVSSADGASLMMEGMEIDQVLEFAGVNFGEETSATMPINIYLSKADHEKHEKRLEFLASQLPGLTTRVMVDGSLAHLAAGMFARSAINLRQGEFAPRSSPEKILKPWRFAAGLAAAVLVVLLAGEAVQLMVLKNREKAVDERISATFQEVFPNVTLRGDPANQMRSELAALRAAAGSTDSFFLEALDALATATRGENAGRLDSISFRNGVIDLKIIVPSVEVLDRIRQGMEKAGGLAVELESANPSGDQVEGRIQLQRAPA